MDTKHLTLVRYIANLGHSRRSDREHRASPYEIDTPLRELARKIGHRDAVRAWRRSRLTVNSLKAHLNEAGIASTTRSTLYLAGRKFDSAALTLEARARL